MNNVAKRAHFEHSTKKHVVLKTAMRVAFENAKVSIKDPLNSVLVGTCMSSLRTKYGVNVVPDVAVKQ